MQVKINFRTHVLILLAGLASAAIACLLLIYLLEGPGLGAHYDFLLSLKKPQAVSSEILIINTDEIIEPNDKYLVLMTLTELGGANLIITDTAQAPSRSLLIDEAAIRMRLYDEYVLLGANIRNLFEAIRSGSVSPMQAPGYVERLVELTEQGRDRLLNAIIDRDEDMIRAIAAFGGYMEAAAYPMYDKDGKLRRVQPADIENYIEHPVYTILKHRYAYSEIENTKNGMILKLKKHENTAIDGGEIIIPLDNNRNIITPHNAYFRAVDISFFRDYDEACRIMREVLVYADTLGAFTQTLPEQSPLFLGDYSDVLKKEMLINISSENRIAYLSSRENYFKSLENFIAGPSEELIVKRYNDVIKEEGLESLILIRDELIQAFVFIRAQHAILKEIRVKLEEEVYASFCIMGRQPNTRYSALLANAIITGSHINPAPQKQVMLWSFAAVFIALSAVFWLKPFMQLLFGFCLNILFLLAFSFLFIYYSIWIDPLISFGAGCFGTLIIFSCKYSLSKMRIRRFRAAFGSAVSPGVLNELIKQGKPNPEETVETFAAVIAIKDINLLAREDQEKPQEAGKLKKKFFSSVKDAVFKAGGVIAGFEGDTIIACFGSPLDKTGDPVSRASIFVNECLRDGNNTWRFGIDSGFCTFYWSHETGFGVHGRPSVRARILASRTVRFKKRALITDNIREKLDIEVERIELQGNEGKSIFEFFSIN